jgi:hypothetical protein
VADTQPTSFKLSEIDRAVLEEIAARDGCSNVDVMRRLIRNEGRRLGLLSEDGQLQIGDSAPETDLAYINRRLLAALKGICEPIAGDPNEPKAVAPARIAEGQAAIQEAERGS